MEVFSITIENYNGDYWDAKERGIQLAAIYLGLCVDCAENEVDITVSFTIAVAGSRNVTFGFLYEDDEDDDTTELIIDEGDTPPDLPGSAPVPNPDGSPNLDDDGTLTEEKLNDLYAGAEQFLAEKAAAAV